MPRNQIAHLRYGERLAGGVLPSARLDIGGPVAQARRNAPRTGPVVTPVAEEIGGDAGRPAAFVRE